MVAKIAPALLSAWLLVACSGIERDEERTEALSRIAVALEKMAAHCCPQRRELMTELLETHKGEWEPVLFAHVKIGEGWVTGAMSVHGDYMDVAVALCSPEDQFSRRKGRLIAGGRLAKGLKFARLLRDGKPPWLQFRTFIEKWAAGDDSRRPRWMQGGFDQAHVAHCQFQFAIEELHPLAKDTPERTKELGALATQAITTMIGALHEKKCVGTAQLTIQLAGFEEDAEDKPSPVLAN